jgi:hypothetical protein
MDADAIRILEKRVEQRERNLAATQAKVDDVMERF